MQSLIKANLVQLHEIDFLVSMESQSSPTRIFLLWGRAFQVPNNWLKKQTFRAQFVLRDTCIYILPLKIILAFISQFQTLYTVTEKLWINVKGDTNSSELLLMVSLQAYKFWTTEIIETWVLILVFPLKGCVIC